MNRTFLHRLRISIGRAVYRGVEILFALLPVSVNVIILRGVAKSLNIIGIGYAGQIGEIYGSPQDMHVMGVYVKSGQYSPQILNTVVNYFKEKPTGTFVDIGANIGMISIPISKLGISCHCFEPDPRNFELLGINAYISKSSTMRLYNVALYNREATLQFEMSPSNFGDKRIRKSEGSGQSWYSEDSWSVIDVAAKRLDEIIDVEGLQRPIFVKMDIQGAEAAAVEGGENFFSKVDEMLFEFSVYMLKRQDADVEGLIRFIETHFSEGTVVDQDGPTHWVSIAEVASSMRGLLQEYPHLRSIDVCVRK